MDGDPTNVLITKALARSPSWWKVVTPLTGSFPAGVRGVAAVLIYRPRTVCETGSGDEVEEFRPVKSTRLWSVLDGSVGQISVCHSSSPDGLRRGHRPIPRVAPSGPGDDRSIRFGVQKEPADARWYFFGPESNQPRVDPFPPASTLGLTALVLTYQLNFTAEDAAADPSWFDLIVRAVQRGASSRRGSQGSACRRVGPRSAFRPGRHR